jgi:hypothetical protein
LGTLLGTHLGTPYSQPETRLCIEPIRHPVQLKSREQRGLPGQEILILLIAPSVDACHSADVYARIDCVFPGNPGLVRWLNADARGRPLPKQTTTLSFAMT